MEIDVLGDPIIGREMCCTTCTLAMEPSHPTLTMRLATSDPPSPQPQCWIWIGLPNPEDQSGATHLPFGRGLDQAPFRAATGQPQHRSTLMCGGERGLLMDRTVHSSKWPPRISTQAAHLRRIEPMSFASSEAGVARAVRRRRVRYSHRVSRKDGLNFFS